MSPLITILNETDERIQLQLDTNKTGLNNQKFFKVSYVNYHKIPLSVVETKPINMYSTLSRTKEYIEESLLKYWKPQDNALGLLLKGNSSNNNVYLIMYISQTLNLKALLLNLNNLRPVVTSSFPSKEKSIDNVFEKVLQRKKNPKPTRELSSSVLTNSDKINLTVSKIILSGLRLRGLSSNMATNSNEKLKIKEIYQMTMKATLFSLRKFNHNNQPIKLNDIQDTVERLLQIFVDIETSNTSSPFIE